jgi:hypothetical protein
MIIQAVKRRAPACDLRIEKITVRENVRELVPDLSHQVETHLRVIGDQSETPRKVDPRAERTNRALRIQKRVIAGYWTKHQLEHLAKKLVEVARGEHDLGARALGANGPIEMIRPVASGGKRVMVICHLRRRV